MTLARRKPLNGIAQTVQRSRASFHHASSQKPHSARCDILPHNAHGFGNAQRASAGSFEMDRCATSMNRS
ncbi:hypothetical protein WQE_03342 [Paraburkholderia hospita]|uniref:Uncharacterized protein n=1 Tax=Paraburkholderia hospita TaxID=169430 RepID=A0ABN0FUQ2_9BURK|nr:hypothetical protein WQE_03342 [Paraburkholderia hospita]